MHAPHEIVVHARSHGYPIDHLIGQYRSRSPRQSVTASASSYVPMSSVTNEDVSVFDDASLASSRVIAAEIHSPPRPVSSQMPTASAQPLAQSTQVPSALPLIPTTVPLAQSPLSVHTPTPHATMTCRHCVTNSNVARLPRFDTSLSLGLYVTEAHVAMTLPRRACDVAFRQQLATDFPATMAQAEQMSVVEIARAMAPVYESWQLEL